ncbi:MAG: DUF3515 domain-containing protein [Pseudonocardia sp.]
MTSLGGPARLAIALPLLLALVVAGIGITARLNGSDPAAAVPDTRPLAVVPVDAPAAAGPECAALLAALPADLPSDAEPLPPRAIAEPAPPGARAWTAAPRPVVLRCGLTRPAELTPTSRLLEVDGVSWLQLDDGVPDPVTVSYVAVDRPVYMVLTAPPAVGSGPLQAVSAAVRAALPEVPVAVR